MKKIIVNALSREKRMAVVEDEQLQHIHIMNKHEESIVGNIYIGRVEKIVPGMDAAFVHFGGNKNGFLHKADVISSNLKPQEASISQLVTQGEKILIQVVRDETEHKGARVTGFVEISTANMVYIPHQNYIAVSKKMSLSEREKWKKIAHKYQEKQEGMLIRTEMSTKSEGFFLKELNHCREVYHGLVQKMKNLKAPALLVETNQIMKAIQQEMKSGSGVLYVDEFSLFQELQKHPLNWEIIYYSESENIFDAMKVEHQLERLYKRIVWLENGGFLIVEEGETMTTIDVNTGKFIGKTDKEQTLFETNKLAAEEAMRQIKLRNLSGMILIDFINSDYQQEILSFVQQLAQKDATTIQVVGFTKLGILQLTRKVTSPSLLQYATTVCTTCQGTGRVESAQATAFRLERALLQYRNKDYQKATIELSKDVLEWFTGENKFFKERIERDTGLFLQFTVKENVCPFFHIKQLDTGDI